MLYTDGSFLEDPISSSCAVFSANPIIEKAWSRSSGTSIFSAEIWAIKKALDTAYHLEDYFQNVFIMVDSQSAIQAICSPDAKKVNPLPLQVINSAKSLKSMGTKVTLVWVPSHVGIPGNEKVDKLAVEESKNPSSSRICNRLSPSEDFSVFKKLWSDHLITNLHAACSKPTVRFRQRPGIVSWHFAKNRRHSTALHRIRSGHNLLNKFKFRLDEGADPSCRHGCDSIEDASHLILVCPHLAEHRETLSSACQELEVTFDLESITGVNPSYDKSTQLKIRDLFITFLKATKMRFMV